MKWVPKVFLHEYKNNPVLNCLFSSSWHIGNGDPKIIANLMLGNSKVNYFLEILFNKKWEVDKERENKCSTGIINLDFNRHLIRGNTIFQWLWEGVKQCLEVLLRVYIKYFSINQSYRLCWRCHREKGANWKVKTR